jgi:hypothetical protein
MNSTLCSFAFFKDVKQSADSAIFWFIYCSPLWDTCGKVHKDKLQMLQNRAARVITGARFVVNSENILEDLQSSTLDVRRHRQYAPSLREKYDLRSNDADLAFPKPKTNYLKRIKYSGAMLWNCLRRKRHLRFTNLIAVYPLYKRLRMWVKIVCKYNTLLCFTTMLYMASVAK